MSTHTDQLLIVIQYGLLHIFDSLSFIGDTHTPEVYIISVIHSYSVINSEWITVRIVVL